jgi:hypothetical protein
MKAFTVSVGVSDLSASARQLAGVVHAAAERVGGRDIVVEASDDTAELELAFVVDAADEEAARDAGHAVVGAVEADSFARSVGVFTSWLR